MIGIKEIGQTFTTTLSSLRKPANVISAIIMLCAMVRRPGLSCLMSTSNVLQDIAKRGCPTGPLPDGSPNLMNELVTSIVCEIFRAIKEDANIQIAMPPGALTINATGSNAGGPVTCVGTNIMPGSGVGVVQ
jgi:hypothetical protein